MREQRVRYWSASLLALVPGVLGAQAGPERVDEVPVRCQVVDESGGPIVGAEIYIGPPRSTTTSTILSDPRARSGADGKFHCKYPGPKPQIGAVEQDFAWIAHPDYATVRIPLATGQYVYTPWGAIPVSRTEHAFGRVEMIRGRRLVGMVRGAGGRPLAGARVVVCELWGSGYYGRFSSRASKVFASSGVTDARGRFDLGGVFPGAVSLVVSAAGHYDSSIRYVRPGSNVDVAMEPSGFAAGRVVDGEGKPVHAILNPQFESGDSAHAGEQLLPVMRTDADGRFKVSISHRGRYSIQVHAVLRPGEAYRYAHSEAYRLPRDDIQIEMAARAEDNKPIALTVIDKATGKPVAEAEAAVVWQEPQYLNPVVLDTAFRSSARKTGSDGVVELPGPRAQQPPKGTLLVRVKGYAPRVHKGIEYDGEKPPEIRVELVRESVVRGVVVDQKTGATIEGARISVTVAGAAVGANAGSDSDLPVSDDSGAFRVGGLGAGQYEVTAEIEGRPTSEVVRLNLEPAKVGKALRIEIPRGATLAGRVFSGFDAKGVPQPVRLPPGWKVSLVPSIQNNGGYYSPFSSFLPSSTQNGGPAEPVALNASGEFRFEGLGADRYRLNLIAPKLSLRGSPVTTVIEPLRVRRKDMSRDFDVAEDVPGVIRGKVRVTGVEFPPDRLFVLSVPLGTRGTAPSRVAFNQSYFRGLVGADGSFVFAAPRGRHHLYFMDGAYSTVLFCAPELVEVEYGKPAEVAYEIPLTRLRVRLLPGPEGGPVVANRLEWMVVRSGESPHYNFGRYPQGFGCPLQGRRELLLVMPPERVSFVVSLNSQYVDPQGQHGHVIVGEIESELKLGRLNTVDIPVTSPPDLSNLAPPKAAAKPEDKNAKLKVDRAEEGGSESRR